MFDLADGDIFNSTEGDIATLSDALRAAGYDAEPQDVAWAWARHSLNNQADWLVVDDADRVRWLLRFLAPPRNEHPHPTSTPKNHDGNYRRRSIRDLRPARP